MMSPFMTRQALTAFGRSGVIAATLAGCLCVGHLALAQPALWGELRLPGGADAAREVLVLGDSDGRLDATLLVDFVRRFANTDLRTAADRFEQHIASSSAGVSSLLPLPLPAFWQSMFGTDNAAQLRGLLRSRNALLVYHGLMSLDPDTLRSFETRQVLLRDLADNNTASAAFAAFASGLRLDNDSVLTPGDADDQFTWQTLVGASPNTPDPFLRALFTRDNGRLAWFYDTVAALPDDARTFVLMSHLPPAERAPAVADVYARFGSVESGWRIDTRPFHRPPFDGALALLALEPREDGTVGPAWWPAVFDRLMRQSDWSALPADATQPDRPADARWVFNWLFGNADDGRQRFAMLRFAQRRLADVPPEDASHVAAILGGVRDLPMLMFTLERLGVRDPALLADAARTARRVTYSGNETRVRPMFGRWQIALGLLEQVQRRAHLPADRVEALVREWIATAPSNADAATATTAAWLVDHLLPALADSRQSGESIEDTFLRAATTSSRDGRLVFTWEGLDYAVDDGGAAYRSAATIRRARPGPRLDDIVELHDVFGGVKAATTPRALRALSPRVAELARAVQRIDRPGDRRIRDLVHTAVQMGIDAGRAEDHISAIGGALDVMTETVVASLLYALAVSPSSEPVLYPDAWSRHALEQPRGVPGGARRAWREVAWQFPTDYGLGGGTRLTGAYLGVDIALADAQLTRVASETLPVPGAIDDPIRRGLVEQLVLASDRIPAELPATIAADIASARQMVESWIASPPADDVMRRALRAARLDEWRVNAILWNVSRGRSEVLRLLTMSDFAALGMSRNGGDIPMLPWAGSSRLVDGCHCQNVMRGLSADGLRGRRIGIQTFRINDAAVRLAEVLQTLGLDGRLVPALLPMAFQDWLDHSRPAWLDDWDAYALWPRSLDVERVEAYLLHLVSTGVFSPPAPEESR